MKHKLRLTSACMLISSILLLGCASHQSLTYTFISHAQSEDGMTSRVKCKSIGRECALTIGGVSSDITEYHPETDRRTYIHNCDDGHRAGI